MLTIKKIRSLKPRVRVRKLGGIFHEAYSGVQYGSDYLSSCLSQLLSEDLLEEKDRKDILFSLIMEGKAGRIYITGPSIFWGRLLQTGTQEPKAETQTGERGKYGNTTSFLTICALPIMWALCSAPLKASE